MIAFENDIFPRQIAAQPPGAKPRVANPLMVKPKSGASVLATAGAKGAVVAPSRPAGSVPAGGSPTTISPNSGFQIVFEAEIRSLAPRPGASVATPKPAAAATTGFLPVFEAETLPPLPPQPQTASTSPTGATGKSGEVPLWDNGGFSFSDILDVINPLQHLPIISTIYREETGDKIGAIPRILGSMLFGGGLIGAAVGAATAVVNLAVEQETGKDIGAHIYTAIFGEGGKNAKTTTVATGPAAATPAAQAAATAARTKAAVAAAAAKRQTPVATPRPAPTTAAITPAAPKPKPTPAAAAPTAATKAGPPSGGVRVSGKAAGPTSLATAATKAVSSQFRRSAWYRKNQDVLAAQAIELARARAAAQARAGKSTVAGANGPRAKPAAPVRPDMLRLFTGKAAAASKSTAGGTTTRSTTNTPAPIPKATMAREMSKAMAKYELLLKSRVASGAKAGQLK